LDLDHAVVTDAQVAGRQRALPPGEEQAQDQDRDDESAQEVAASGRDGALAMRRIGEEETE
jgi:hypothetical protein